MISGRMHAAWCIAPTRSTGMGLPLGRVLPQVCKLAFLNATYLAIQKHNTNSQS